MEEKRVTIVMTVRETYDLTLQTIDSLIKNTTVPYRFIFVNYKVPEFILQQIMLHEDIEIVVSDSPYPSVSMCQIIPLINTQYSVFLDNNILFASFWLEKLIECMETNNAGIVGPVYLWNKNKIHMFGGDININNNNFMEKHYLVNESNDIIKNLKPRKCDYVEFHCLMVRTDLLKMGILDPSILMIHEHIDLSLSAKKLGYATYTTPYSMITYVNEVELTEYDLSLFKERWNTVIAEKDIQYFCKKWGFHYNNTFDNVRNFVKNHIRKYLNR